MRFSHVKKTMAFVILPVALAICPAACGPSAKRQEITETRTVTAQPQLPNRQATSAERFGFEAPQTTAPPHTHEAEPSYEWETPETWTAARARPMRLATYTVGPAGQTECYVTVLSGVAGGLEANINRWQRQMGQPALSAEAIQALPQITVLDRPSPIVEITGDYTGMMAGAHQGFMMLATICTLPDQTVFIKMTGPEAEVRAEKDHFVAFCESFHQ